MILKNALIILSLASSMILHAQTKKPAPASSAASKSTIMARGEQVYKISCITCHQMDAMGVPYLNPPLVKTKFILGDKKALIRIVIKGKTEPVEIDGVTYTNPMPAQVQLNDQQIADVLSYIRNSFGNKASMVSVSEVKSARATAK